MPRFLTCWLCLLCLCQPSLAQAGIELQLENTPSGVKVTLPWPGGALWRAYQAVEPELNQNSVRFDLDQPDFLDQEVPDGVWLYYMAEDHRGRVVEAAIRRPDRALPTLLYPRIQVDKLNYTLTVLDGDEEAKRYPISLGGNPTNRKFCLDRLSTPEGVYRISHLQPRATFYRAFDIDYPNQVDEWRYQLSREAGLIEKTRSIGGEIQIHGDGIDGNWTHGCMGLRNRDMDELFSQSRLEEGVEVFITGSQIKPQDRPWLLIPPQEYVAKVQEVLNEEGFRVGTPSGRMDQATSLALGRLQRVNGLAISCQLETQTREFLLKRFDIDW